MTLRDRLAALTAVSQPTPVGQLSAGTGGWISPDSVVIDRLGGLVHLNPAAAAHPVQQSIADRFVWLEGATLYVTGIVPDEEADDRRPAPSISHSRFGYVVPANSTDAAGARLFSASGHAIQPGGSVAAWAPYAGIGPGGVVRTGHRIIPIN